MRKILRVEFSLFAVLAFCALAAVPAIADEFLVNGIAFSGELSTETEGTLVLEKFESANSETELGAVECNGIFDGAFEGSRDRVTDLLNLEMGVIGTLNSEDTAKTGISCTVTFHAGAITDCKVGTLATVWVIGIVLELEDWVNTELLLNGSTITDMVSPVNNLALPAGYEVECESLLGIRGSEECTEASEEATLTNSAATTPPSVLAIFGVTPVANRANCTMTGAHSAQFLGEGNLWAIGAELERIETTVN